MSVYQHTKKVIGGSNTISYRNLMVNLMIWSGNIFHQLFICIPVVKGTVLSTMEQKFFRKIGWKNALSRSLIIFGHLISLQVTSTPSSKAPGSSINHQINHPPGGWLLISVIKFGLTFDSGWSSEQVITIRKREWGNAVAQFRSDELLLCIGAWKYRTGMKNAGPHCTIPGNL